jgi:hypothetical protein
VTFLSAAAVSRWLVCGGSAALEETEAAPAERILEALPIVAERKAALEAQGAAVQAALGVRVDIGIITGERGATAIIQGLLIAEWEDHSRVEVHGHELVEAQLLTLAALIKYSLLHNFTETSVGSVEELYAVGQRMTEAAALALSLRGDVSALSHLTEGPQCSACSAAYRCPQLSKGVFEDVFGEIQAPDDVHLQPVLPRVRVGPPEDLPALIAAALERIPMIEDWCASVRDHAVLLGLIPRAATVPRVKRQRKKRRKYTKRAKTSPP